MTSDALNPQTNDMANLVWDNALAQRAQVSIVDLNLALIAYNRSGWQKIKPGLVLPRVPSASQKRGKAHTQQWTVILFVYSIPQLHSCHSASLRKFRRGG